MKRHGGQMERPISCARSDDANEPDEVHVVTFPTEAAFERYPDDPGLVALTPLRARAIRQTIVGKSIEASRVGGADESSATRGS